jgi:hypothetical protein
MNLLRSDEGRKAFADREMVARKSFDPTTRRNKYRGRAPGGAPFSLAFRGFADWRKVCNRERVHDANLTTEQVANASSVYRGARMKFRMTKTLRFWVDCEYHDINDENVDSTRTQLIAKILCEFQEAGDAMRYLNSKGQIAWKATPEMLSKLADAEQEAEDDLADVP